MARMGRVEEAVELIRSRLDAAGNPAGLFLLEGRFLVTLGENEEAELAFREALRRDPETLDAWVELGNLLSADGRDDEARRMLEEAVDRGTRNPAAYFRLAFLAEQKGSEGETEAIALYRRALDLAPDDPVTLNNLAMVLVRNPDTLEEALAVVRRARKARPDDPYIADTLGFILMKTDRLEEAIPLLIEAAEAIPGNAEVQHHAGMACFRDYQWDDARRFLRRALRLDPEAVTAEEARAALRKIR